MKKTKNIKDNKKLLLEIAVSEYENAQSRMRDLDSKLNIVVSISFRSNCWYKHSSGSV